MSKVNTKDDFYQLNKTDRRVILIKNKDMIKRILFPTDFSENALKAYRFALIIAHTFGSEIILIHIESYDNIARFTVGEGVDKKAQDTKSRLKKFISQPPNTAPFNKDRIPEVMSIIKQGDIVEGIIKCSLEYRADLVIMGTQGENSTLKKIFGGVSTKVLERVICPVLLIPSDAALLSFEEISIATNYSKNDEEALEWVLQFARRFSGGVNAVHIDQSPTLEAFQNKNITSKDCVYMMYDHLPMKVLWNPSVLNGLEAYIEQQAPNMVVLISPTRSLWDLLFVNSLTHDLAVHTKVPLLIIHGDKI